MYHNNHIQAACTILGFIALHKLVCNFNFGTAFIIERIPTPRRAEQGTKTPCSVLLRRISTSYPRSEYDTESELKIQM